ncbi:MAG TPA: hypothetical protein VI318_17390 [Baekduia sp.]
MATDPVPRRDVLMGPYRHPLRHCAAAVWRSVRELRSMLVVAGLCAAVGVAAGVAVGAIILALMVAVGVLIAIYVLLAWGWLTVRETWRLVRSWRRRSELADVLARRPQAGTEDPELAHDLFAVTVEDDGRLLTWRFRPLTIGADPGADEIEVPGRPRHAARGIEDRAFAADDAARAAEQLIEAQERAAEREAAAAAEAHRAVEASRLSDDLLLETRSTAAALQHATGQRRRRD